MIELQRNVTSSPQARLGVDCTLILSLNAEMITVTAPWDEPVDLAPFITPGKRTFIASTFGEVQGRWCDGPLAHVLESGLVASYLPAGGAATLKIPKTTSGDVQGVTWERAKETEGTLAARAQRCLIGCFEEKAKPLGLGEPGFTLAAERLALEDALALVLFRQAAPRAEIRLAVAAAASHVPPAWRRLLQNVGVWLDAGKASPGLATALESFGDMIPAAARPDLAAHLNLKSDVLPKKLEETACAF